MYTSLEKANNGIKNMNAVYTTAALFCTELFCEDTLFDFIRLITCFQDLALTSSVLNASQKIHLHVVALSLLALVSHLFPILQDYFNKVNLLIPTSVMNLVLIVLRIAGSERQKRARDTLASTIENKI